MLFIVDGVDHPAPEGLARRTVARQAHLASLGRLRDAGQLVYAATLLDATGRDPIGWLLLLDVPSRGSLDVWLANDPFVTQRVWSTVSVRLARPAPVPTGR